MFDVVHLNWKLIDFLNKNFICFLAPDLTSFSISWLPSLILLFMLVNTLFKTVYIITTERFRMLHLIKYTVFTHLFLKSTISKVVDTYSTRTSILKQNVVCNSNSHVWWIDLISQVLPLHPLLCLLSRPIPFNLTKIPNYQKLKWLGK